MRSLKKVRPLSERGRGWRVALGVALPRLQLYRGWLTDVLLLGWIGAAFGFVGAAVMGMIR